MISVPTINYPYHHAIFCHSQHHHTLLPSPAYTIVPTNVIHYCHHQHTLLTTRSPTIAPTTIHCAQQVHARFDAWKPLGIVGLWIIVVGYVYTVFIKHPITIIRYHTPCATITRYHTPSTTITRYHTLPLTPLGSSVCGSSSLGIFMLCYHSSSIIHFLSRSHTLSHTLYHTLSHPLSTTLSPFHKVLAVEVLVVSMGDCVCHRHLYGREIWYVETKTVS